MTKNLQPAFASAGSITHDNLLAGDAVPVVTDSVKIAKGQVLPRGAVLGVIGTGEYVLSASGATDGSQTIKAILAEDTDATDGPVTTVAYLSGEFNTNALTLGVGHTVASIKDGLRDLGIYLKTNLPA